MTVQARGEAIVAAALGTVLIVATLGEGGGAPGSLLAWHAAVALLVAWRVLAPHSWPSPAVSVGDGVTGALALFSVIVALGALRAPYGYAAWLTGVELVACLGAGWLAASAGASLLPRLVPPLATLAALHALGAAVERLRALEVRPAGTFLNPNHLAAWLVAVALLTLAAAIGGARAGRQRVLLAGLAALALGGVLLSGSRGAFAGLAVGGAVSLVLHWQRLEPAVRRGAAAGAAVLAVALGVALVIRLADPDPFRYHRLRIWGASLAMIAEQPVWGTGPGQLAEASARFQFPDGEPPLRYDRRFTATHSDLLRAPAELGLPAVAALAVAVIAGLRRTLRRRRSPGLSAEADGALAALAALAVHATVDNPSSWPSVYLLASVLAAALLAQPRPTPPAPSPGVRARLVLVTSLVVVVAVGEVAPFLAWRAARGPALDLALRFNPVHPAYRLAVAELEIARGLELRSYARAREGAEAAVRLAPASAEIHRGAARIEAQACRTLFRDAACRDRARAAWERAAERAPKDPALPVELAAFLLDLGDVCGARRAAERALALEPEAVLPRLLLADALLEGGGAAGAARARTLLEQAQALAARWSARASGPYAQRMMRLDGAVVARLRDRLHAVEQGSVAAGDLQ
jgi:O-antigen ligase